MSSIKSLVIIGSGPAAWTAAIYAARSNLKPIVFEGFFSGPVGGQLMTTTDIENFPGFPNGIAGSELMENMKKQALRFATEVIAEDVVSVDLLKNPFSIQGSSTKILTHALIIATGSFAKRLAIPGTGDNEFWQRGVSSCAVCDGAAPIFRDKELFVIGGGDTAAEEALFLTRYAKKVYIVHRRDVLRASKIMVDRVKAHPKITILWNQEVIKVLGDKFVHSVMTQDVMTKKQQTREAAGLFFAIGHKPNTEFLQNQLQTNEIGYLTTKENTLTSKDGVFAAGDVIDPHYRQAIVAAGSGCMAAMDAEKWLISKGW